MYNCLVEVQLHACLHTWDWMQAPQPSGVLACWVTPAAWLFWSCFSNDKKDRRLICQEFIDLPVLKAETLACARQGPMTPSSRTLDNHYYDVAADPGAYPGQRLLFSDRLLHNGSATAGQFETFRTGQSAWAAAFAAQYQEMTMLGVQPSQGYGVNSGWCDGCGEYRGSAVRSSSLPSFLRGAPEFFP